MGRMNRSSEVVSAATWRGAEPPKWRPLTGYETLRASVRVGAFLLMTALSLALFVPGRYLRHWLGSWVTFHFVVATLWSRATLWLCGLKLRVEGRPVKAGALVANHSSWIDIPAIRAGGLVYFVSKAEVADWPGVGWITRVTGTIFIERRRTEAKRQEQMLRERIAADQRLCFFPEGTSTDNRRVLPFKTSLFSVFYEDGDPADLAVQPVTIRYRVAPGCDLPEEFYAWWGSMAFEGHVWQVMGRSRGGTVDIVFHEALRPADHEDRKALASRAHRIAAMDLPHA